MLRRQEKAHANLAKHGVSFAEAASVFLDLDFILTDDPTEAGRFIALGFSSQARMLFVVHVEFESSALAERLARKHEPMSDEKKPQAEPSAESLAEMPEVDFSRGIRPNRMAALRGDFKHAVFLDRELWEHFGSEERVVEALRPGAFRGTRRTSPDRRGAAFASRSAHGEPNPPDESCFRGISS